MKIEPPPTDDYLPLNCPVCGCRMDPPAGYVQTPPNYVAECPIHGPYHFSATKPLTPGMPK